MKGFDPNDIKIDQQSYKNILIYYIGYVTIKIDLNIYNVNLLYLIYGKVNGYFEDVNRNKHLTLVPTDERKKKNIKYEKLWSKIKDLFRLINNTLDDNDEKYMKIKFSSDDKLPLNKTVENSIMTIVVRAAFLENNKYYPLFFS